MLTASTRGRLQDMVIFCLFVSTQGVLLTGIDLPYSAESMSVGLDVSKKVYIDEQSKLCSCGWEPTAAGGR